MMSTNHNYTYLNTGRITDRSKHGSYNITEKDFGDHKVRYYIPSSYENNYDLPQLDEEPFYKEQQRHYSPVVVRRRYHSSYDDNNNDYIEELPIISLPRQTYVSPRRPQVIKRIYYDPSPSPPPPQTIEYIYEDDYRPKNEEIVEYIVRDRAPRQRYIEEFQPVRQTTYVTNAPRISHSLPPPSSIKTLHLNELTFPHRPKLKQQIPRKIIPQNNNQQQHISLKDVLAENRARRGTRIPKPRREVDEEQFHDPPTYNKNFVKNDFLVHK